MLNAQKKFQRAHGNINVKINKNEINRFYQSGSAKVFYPKSQQEIKELVLVNTAGGLTSGDNFFYNVEITNKSKIFVTTQTAERVYKGINDNAEIINIKKIMGLVSNKKYTKLIEIKSKMQKVLTFQLEIESPSKAYQI